MTACGYLPVYLSQGLIALIDADDEDRVMEMKWCAVNHKGRFYASKRYRTDDRITYLHRFVLDAPGSRQVRFVNGYTLDCRKANLVLCNDVDVKLDERLRRGSTSSFRGVDLMNGRTHKPWRAQIEVRGVKRYLGTFDTELEAAQAYDCEAKRLRGEGAKLNFAM